MGGLANGAPRNSGRNPGLQFSDCEPGRKKRTGGRFAPRGGPPEGRQKAAPLSGGRSHPTGPGPPGAPSGGGGAGGRRGEPHRHGNAGQRHRKPRTARRAAQRPGGQSHPERAARPAAPRAGSQPGPKPRSGPRGEAPASHGRATARRSKGRAKRSASPHRSGCRSKAPGAQRAGREGRRNEAARPRAKKPGGSAEARGRLWPLCGGPAPGTGGGRAAPERTRAGEGAPAQGGTRSAQKKPGNKPGWRAYRFLPRAPKGTEASGTGGALAPGPGAQPPGGRRPRRVCAGGRRGAAAP